MSHHNILRFTQHTVTLGAQNQHLLVCLWVKGGENWLLTAKKRLQSGKIPLQNTQADNIHTDIPRLQMTSVWKCSFWASLLLTLSVFPRVPAEVCEYCVRLFPSHLNDVRLSVLHSLGLYDLYVNQSGSKGKLLILPVNRDVNLCFFHLYTKRSWENKFWTSNALGIRGGVFLLESQFRTEDWWLKGAALFSWCADQTFCGKNHICLIYSSVLPRKGCENIFYIRSCYFSRFISFFHLSKGS